MRPKLVLLLFVAFYLGFRWLNGGLHMSRNPASLPGNTCEGRLTCVVVYLAPWCPHCRAQMPYVQAMLHQSLPPSQLGVRVVVGKGEPEANRKMAAQIARNVEIDDSESVATKLHVRSFPSFLVLDREQTVVVDGDEAYQWVVEHFGR